MKGLFLKEQQHILRGFRLQGRHFATKWGVGVLLALLAVAFLTGLTGIKHTYAATRSTSYTIQYGDTLSGIASTYGVTVSELASANGIADPNVIFAGQTIQIPDGNSTSSGTQETPAPAPQKIGGSYSDMIHQVFGPYGDQAVRVAMCESSMNPNAYNGILGAAGLFQIIPGTWAGTSYANQSVYNPVANIKAAHEIFVRDGYSWREWACKP